MPRTGVSLRLVSSFAFIVFALLGTSCSVGSGCKDTDLQSSRSPDGLTTGSVSTVNCGATTGFFSYVKIKTDQVRLRDDGVLFAYKGSPNLSLIWSGPKNLRIECTSGCTENKIYRQVTKEGDYTIEYSGFAP